MIIDVKTAAPINHMTTSVEVILSLQCFHIRISVHWIGEAIKLCSYLFSGLDLIRLPEGLIRKYQIFDIFGARFIDGDPRVCAVAVFVAGKVSR